MGTILGNMGNNAHRGMPNYIGMMFILTKTYVIILRPNRPFTSTPFLPPIR